MAEIFKSYDVRGIYPSDINEDIVYRIGRALVEYLDAKNLGVNVDSTAASDDIRDTHLYFLKQIEIAAKKESFDIEADRRKVIAPSFKDYRYRFDLLRADAHEDPFIIGVGISGLYLSAIAFHAFAHKKKSPSFAIVKKSQCDELLHVYPSEEEKIRNAIDRKKPIMVIDDFVRSFETFFSIFDYFGKPETMIFSSWFYGSPFPKELNIVEIGLIQYATRRNIIPQLDNGVRNTIETLAQYQTIVRDERTIPIHLPIMPY